MGGRGAAVRPCGEPGRRCRFRGPQHPGTATARRRSSTRRRAAATRWCSCCWPVAPRRASSTTRASPCSRWPPRISSPKSSMPSCSPSARRASMLKAPFGRSRPWASRRTSMEASCSGPPSWADGKESARRLEADGRLRRCSGACPKPPMPPPLSLQEGDELPEVWRARLQALPDAARPLVRAGGWLDFWATHPDGQACALLWPYLLLRRDLVWLYLPWPSLLWPAHPAGLRRPRPALLRGCRR
jgi:hypothetical protein